MPFLLCSHTGTISHCIPSSTYRKPSLRRAIFCFVAVILLRIQDGFPTYQSYLRACGTGVPKSHMVQAEGNERLVLLFDVRRSYFCDKRLWWIYDEWSSEFRCLEILWVFCVMGRQFKLTCDRFPPIFLAAWSSQLYHVCWFSRRSSLRSICGRYTWSTNGCHDRMHNHVDWCTASEFGIHFRNVRWSSIFDRFWSCHCSWCFSIAYHWACSPPTSSYLYHHLQHYLVHWKFRCSLVDIRYVICIKHSNCSSN